MAATITLGGVALNLDIVWLERYQSHGVEQSVRRTLGGVPVIFSGALGKGQPITLEGSTERGALRQAQVAALQPLADTPGAILVLDFNGDQRQVVFRHDEPPALDFHPVQPHTADAASDWMVGQIKLRTV